MNPLLLWFLLSQAGTPLPDGRGSVSSVNAEPRRAREQALPDGHASVSGVPETDSLIKQIVESGRVLALVPLIDDKIRLAPGAPPLLAFRYLEGRQRGRFGGLDLVLDDAGH